MKEYEHKIKEYEKQIEDYDNTFTKLDEILLTDEEKKQDKYLTTSELIQRVIKTVQRVKDLENYIHKAISDFNELLEIPKKSFREIKKAISNKLRFGVEDLTNHIKKVADNSKEINKQLSSSSNPGTKKNEDVDTSNSPSSLKRKFKRNRDK